MLRIIGIEQTQAIQYFGSTFPVCANAQPCPDNSIPLVAGKPTVLRVYFDGAAPNAQVTGLGVKLLPSGAPTQDHFPSRTTLVNVLSPPRREEERDSLNLLVPAALSKGQWRINISVFELGTSGLVNAASTQVELQFIERAILPLRLVRFHYKRVQGGVTVAEVSPPDIAEFWSLAEGFVNHIWPSPLPVFCLVRETVEVFDGNYYGPDDKGILGRLNPGTDTAAARGTTESISQIMRRLRAAEGLPADTIYCGFYPDSSLQELPQGGYGGGRDFVTPNVVPGLMAHELAHALGRPHWFDDPNYPRYGALARGSIGEVGFDAIEPMADDTPPNGRVPARTHIDITGYSHPRWISPYTYTHLFQAVGAPSASSGCPRPSLPPQGEFYPKINRRFTCYYVPGLISGDISKAICGPALKVQFPPLLPPLKGDGLPLPGRVTMLDHHKNTLWTDTFGADTIVADDVEPLPEGPGSRSWPGFSISVPDIDGAARLIVEYNGKVIEDSELSVQPVQLKAKAYMLEGEWPSVRAEWSLGSEDKEVSVFVRASSDGGRSWTAFNVPDGATHRDIDPVSLPPGDSCIVEVLAGARLRTTSWRSDPFAVRTGYDQLIVLQPRGGTKLVFGDALVLSAVSAHGAGYDEIIWSSDRGGDLGTGGYQVVRLPPGKHRLSVRYGAYGELVPGGEVEVANPGDFTASSDALLK